MHECLADQCTETPLASAGAVWTSGKWSRARGEAVEREQGLVGYSGVCVWRTAGFLQGVQTGVAEEQAFLAEVRWCTRCAELLIMKAQMEEPNSPLEKKE